MVALLGLLISAGLVVSSGSQRPLPAPFGPAANGSMYYHGADGLIYAMDPSTGDLDGRRLRTRALSVPAAVA